MPHMCHSLLAPQAKQKWLIEQRAHVTWLPCERALRGHATGAVSRRCFSLCAGTIHRLHPQRGNFILPRPRLAPRGRFVSNVCVRRGILHSTIVAVSVRPYACVAMLLTCCAACCARHLASVACRCACRSAVPVSLRARRSVESQSGQVAICRATSER